VLRGGGVDRRLAVQRVTCSTSQQFMPQYAQSCASVQPTMFDWQ
jgi:hypothetical protein